MMMINRRRVCGGEKTNPYTQYFVDLGLPSGTLWADRNLGATAPENAGMYFSWGNIDGHYAGAGYDFSSANYANTDGASLTGNIPLSQDAAYNLWGDCQMPDWGAVAELVNNTTSVWTSENGVNGRRFTGTNGKSIFFPVTGRYDGTRLVVTSSIFCWLRTWFVKNYGRTFYSTSSAAPSDYQRQRAECGIPIRAIKITT